MMFRAMHRTQLYSLFRSKCFARLNASTNPSRIVWMEELLQSLNEAQHKAVTHTDGPLLIVAGAGTGKTTVLTRRYAHLLNQGCTTDRLLALTFTEKAAGEMEDRVLELLPTGTYDFWISTFHGFCQRVLEAHGLEIGLPNQFRLLNPTDAWLLLKRRLNELPLDHYRPLGNPTKFLRAFVQHISRAKDEGVTPETYLDFAQNARLDGDSEVADGERKRLQELADMYFAYRRILLEEGSLDFGDLILETLRLFRERPAVLETYRKQFRYVMIDEFQDTNWAQYELIKLLAGDQKNLTVVGDDDQAIYKFRGASLANILQFRDDFPEAVTVALTENYRSCKEILDTAYTFIKKNNPNRLEVKLKDTGLSKQLTSVCGEGGKIEVVWKKSIEDEAEYITERISNLKSQTTGLTWNDFVILTRSNDGAEPFVRALERKGIPFQFMALRGLYSKPTVLDVIALLSLLDTAHESPAVWRAMHMGCYSFPSKDVALLLEYARRKGLTLWLALKQSADARISQDGYRVASKLVTHVEGLAEASRRELPLRMLKLALEKTEYLNWVMRLPEQEKRDSLQHLNGMAERIKRYEHSTHGPSLRGFLEELRLEMESGEEGGLNFDPESGPELVKIMTVHAAKGLEFKHVFIVSMVDQRFPTRVRGEAIPLPDGLVKERLPEGDAHLEEERRLFYVALTRAKDTLTITGATNYGGSRAKKPSPFFLEAELEVPESVSSSEDEIRHLQLPAVDQDQISRGDLIHYELKKKFSFTQLAAFRKCPLQYKFEHIYRIPKFGTYQKSFGQSVHNAYQNILNLHLVRCQSVQGNLFDVGANPSVRPDPGTKGPGQTDGPGQTHGSARTVFKVTEEEALKIFEESWIDEWYESRKDHDTYKTNGRRAIKNFWQAFNEKLPDVYGVEIPFTLVLGLHSLKGKIDRVDKLPDGSYAVYDYKTGQAKEELDAEAKEQLYLYQVALEEKGLKVSKLAYIYVLDWVITEVDLLKEEKRDAFLQKITDRMDDIKISDFQATPSPFTCKYCDFKDICEFKKL
ncbi:ATP-dependent helicase [Candidatus Uhrbacteria bacterium]|nr:ATP-dependent helicase [Candidatus Uhrbacteria bacterium]